MGESYAARAIDVVAGTIMVWFAARFVLSAMR
jgi:hypothetical protein